MSARRIEQDDDGGGWLGHVRGLETRVDGIEREIGVLGKRFEKGFADLNTELRGLGKRLAESPNYRVGDVLDVIVKGAALLGMAASAIIWISTAIAAGPTNEVKADLRHQQDRLTRIERALENLAATRVSELKR